MADRERSHRGDEGLTVVIPVFNGARHLRETLDSLAAQTVPLHQVIVVDDGSADGSVEIARSHQVGARVVEQAHAGVAVARNRGALLTQTSHLCFLDQDDLWAPTRHERLLRARADLGPFGAVITTEHSFWLAADGPALQQAGDLLHETSRFPAVRSTESLLAALREEPPTAEDATVVRGVVTVRDLLAGTQTVTTSYLLDRETFLSAGGCVSAARSMDDYWALMNVARIARVILIDEPSILYRIHPAATTLSTAWPWHALSGVAAMRFGGNLVPLVEARDRAVVAPLDEPRAFFLHQLLQIVDRGGPGALADGVAWATILRCTRRDWVYALRRVLPRWMRAAGRRARDRWRGDGPPGGT